MADMELNYLRLVKTLDVMKEKITQLENLRDKEMSGRKFVMPGIVINKEGKDENETDRPDLTKSQYDEELMFWYEYRDSWEKVVRALEQRISATLTLKFGDHTGGEIK